MILLTGSILRAMNTAARAIAAVIAIFLASIVDSFVCEWVFAFRPVDSHWQKKRRMANDDKLDNYLI